MGEHLKFVTQDAYCVVPAANGEKQPSGMPRNGTNTEAGVEGRSERRQNATSES